MFNLFLPITSSITISAVQFSAWQFALIVVIALVIALVFSIFSLAMLLDCLKRNFDGQAKWIMIILFFNIIGALAYYFNVKKVNL